MILDGHDGERSLLEPPISLIGEQVMARADLTWAALCQHLMPLGLQPLIIPENLSATLADSLQIDDSGDASHLHGPIAASVQDIVRKGTELAQVCLKTVRYPAVGLHLRACGWTSVQEFVRDVVINAAIYRHELVRARLFFGSRKCAVRGLLGGFTETVDIAFLRPATASPCRRVDSHEAASATVWPVGPCLGLSFRLPEGLREWPKLCIRLEDLGFIEDLALGGSSIAVVANRGATTSCGTRPDPAGRFSLRVILRPGTSESERPQLMARLRQAAEFAVSLGGTVLRTGTSSDPHFAALRSTTNI